MNPHLFRWIALALGVSMTGCAERMPTYSWIDETHAMELMAERAARIKTLSSPCRIILTDSNGAPAQLDGAIAARVPGFLRLRAWKFSQSVLDITLTPTGLWLFSVQDHESNGERLSPFATLTAQQLRLGWSFTTGAIPRDGWTRIDSNSKRTVELAQELVSGGSINCEVDRPSLTLRRCTVTEFPGAAVLTLALDRYRTFDGLVVPTQLVLCSERGTMTVFLDDPSLNDEIPPTVFDPPRRALKQP